MQRTEFWHYFKIMKYFDHGSEESWTDEPGMGQKRVSTPWLLDSDVEDEFLLMI
jgi:hypothetical protein